MIDLDEMGASIGSMDDKWYSVLYELRAARDVIEYFRGYNIGHSDECDTVPRGEGGCDCGYLEACQMLRDYDEVCR